MHDYQIKRESGIMIFLSTPIDQILIRDLEIFQEIQII